ncbi:MAG TPA: glutathione S-transferase family protein [Candidatus Binatia bacterium]|nr:glutathione S-transferase family protein [Candidatus Binatia bacterium]
MIKLYHAPMTRSLRVLWLLEELGVPYETVNLAFPADLQKPDYLARSPLGKVPAIEDGDVRMVESGAIVEYLVEKYGGGRLAPPPGSPRRPEYLQWLHWAEATAMPSLGLYFQNIMIKPENERIPAAAEEAKTNIAKWLAVLDKHLAGRKFVAGDEFTAADVMLGYTVAGAKFSGMAASYPNVLAYAARLEERPAYQRATQA